MGLLRSHCLAEDQCIAPGVLVNIILRTLTARHMSMPDPAAHAWVRNEEIHDTRRIAWASLAQSLVKVPRRTRQGNPSRLTLV
jgi:hypothetical protein